jgi:hypothetical protein
MTRQKFSQTDIDIVEIGGLVTGDKPRYLELS